MTSATDPEQTCAPEPAPFFGPVRTAGPSPEDRKGTVDAILSELIGCPTVRSFVSIDEEATMGLSDVLNGMRNGPQGGTSTSSPSGGMSPITMGLPVGPSSNSPQAAGEGSDWLFGLEKMIAGGGAGSILSGGLGELIKKFQQTGQGQVAQSWVGPGSNRSVAPEDLEKAIGADTLDALSQRTGIPRDRILAELKEHLPTTVDTLTPEGRIPSDQEARRWA
jgi:uncharacterized protein YidB (DUF937 family)